MKPRKLGAALAAVLAAGAVGGCAEQTRPRMDIDPRADDALHRMSAVLGRAQSFSFRSVATMEEPVDTGQMAQFIRETRILVRRPDRILAESHQGDDVWTVCYQGRSFTVLRKATNTYTSFQVPGRIDAMLDDVAEKHGLTFPLADLLFSDPYKVLTADAHMGRYVGLHEVEGVQCHHLLFTQEGIDWQIWIAAAQEPVPRKLVIDYKSRPGRPEFSAVLSDWNLSAPAAEEQFKSAVPKDAKKVELAQLREAAERGE
jgi:hypothetical protein